MTNRIIHPEGWAAAKGYANGVLTTEGTLYVGGQIGWTAEQVFEAHDFIGQMEQTLKNIVAVIEAAGGGPEHLVRLTWYVTDKQDYLAHQADVGRVYRAVLGRNFPAMTMVVVQALVEDEALLEIEATAQIPQG
ncbi:RidA family protein [Lacimonas salitolerans]|uniref:RidA family protein n=1 Tax=Lacimonas salitolerans TaxID=1323750 RepID=A0ABW4E923_9RHOB